jgi:phage shock protein C
VVSAPVTPDRQVERSQRLLRSREDRVVGGVAGGIGVYVGIDPVIVRLVFVVLALAGGGGILAYVIAWVVIPEAPADGMPASGSASSDMPRLAGLVLVALGGLLLADRLLPAFSWRYVGPVLLIGLGGLLLAQRGTAR